MEIIQYTKLGNTDIEGGHLAHAVCKKKNHFNDAVRTANLQLTQDEVKYLKDSDKAHELTGVLRHD